MTRLPLTFECGDLRLAATLDSAPGSTGLLYVSGGSEIRAGAFNGQSRMAAKIALAGFPVFRFDRRGVGDSEGENRGFRKARKDIAAALLAFRAIAPQMTRVVGFGNCDAASTLMLANGAGCDALVLSNPWTIEDETNDTPAPSSIRSRYAEKLKNPRELARLMTGSVNIKKLGKGLLQAARPRSAPSSLAEEMQVGVSGFVGPVRFLVAENDRTGQMFLDRWDGEDGRVAKCQNAGHSYVEPHAREWLLSQLLQMLRS